MKRHVHDWFEIQRIFTPPTSSLKSAKGDGRNAAMALEMIQKDQYGFTSVEMQCKGCGDIKFVQEYGDQRRGKGEKPPVSERVFASGADGIGQGGQGGKAGWPA
jgi:hypothetical protein